MLFFPALHVLSIRDGEHIRELRRWRISNEVLTRKGTLRWRCHFDNQTKPEIDSGRRFRDIPPSFSQSKNESAVCRRIDHAREHTHNSSCSGPSAGSAAPFVANRQRRETPYPPSRLTHAICRGSHPRIGIRGSWFPVGWNSGIAKSSELSPAKKVHCALLRLLPLEPLSQSWSCLRQIA